RGQHQAGRIKGVEVATRLPAASGNRFQERSGMATGTAKWFNDSKGFAAITPEGGAEDLLAHFSASQMNGCKTHPEGQKVQFDVVTGPKGKQASNIQEA